MAKKPPSPELLHMEKLLKEHNLTDHLTAITRGVNIVLLRTIGEYKINLLRFKPCGFNKYLLDIADEEGKKWFDGMYSGTLEEIINKVKENHPGFLEVN
ncbi:MAG: hypothetical protein LBT59_17425 [Clostridiales bacterium]|jgi:hypothetical protein|nr:hypothetical protein [Clostridiales bacterium]